MKRKWTQSERVPAKDLEDIEIVTDNDSVESVSSYQYSENSESKESEKSCLEISVLLSLEDMNFQRTSLIPSVKPASDIHKSLNTYKCRAASTIQRFFRTIKSKKNLGRLCFIIKSHTNSIKAYYGFTKLKFWPDLRHHSALLIQRAWKAYKSRTISCLPSPRRQLLAKAVSIGGTLIKINNIFELISSRRSLSPESPERKAWILRRNSAEQLDSKPKCINIIANILSDDSDTVETVSSTPLLEVGVLKRLKQVGCGCFHPITVGSLLMKAPIRVRTKRRIALPEVNIEADTEKCRDRPILKATCIPQLSRDSVFYGSSAHAGLKEQLSVEYKKLQEEFM